MDWRHKAVCRDEDPELFFPVGNSGPALAQVAAAKKVCNRCPVTSQCLAWALETGQDAGVWGGMSEDERRALKRPVSASNPLTPSSSFYSSYSSTQLQLASKIPGISAQLLPPSKVDSC